MKTISYLFFILTCVTSIIAEDEYNWEYASDGLDGYHKAQLSELDGYLYDGAKSNYSKDTGQTWQSHKFLFTSGSSGDSWYRVYGFWNKPVKYYGKYLVRGAGGTSFSEDRINWIPFGLNGIPDDLTYSIFWSTDSTLFVQTENNEFQYKYKTYLTKSNLNKESKDLSFDTIETDFPAEDKLIEVKNLNNILYATTESIFSVGKYYLSTVGGLNWQFDSIPGIDERIRNIFLFENKLFVLTRTQLWRQETENKWVECISELLPNQKNDVFVYHRGKIISYTVKGGLGILIESSDGGDSWKRYGTSDFEVLQLISVGERLIASTRYGIKYSDNNGKTWEYGNKGIFRTNDRRLHYNYLIVGDNEEFLTTPRNKIVNKNHLMKTYNGGKSWEKIPINTNDSIPSDYIVTQNEFGIIAININTGKAYRTGNLGESWNLLSEEWGSAFINPFFTYLRNDTIFYFSTASQNYYYSIDGGANFQEINYSFRDNSPDDTFHWVIVNGIHYNRESKDNPKIYKSTNSGLDWEYFNTLDFQKPVTNFANIVFINEEKIIFDPYGNHSDVEIYLSEDIGKNWVNLEMPFTDSPPNMWINHNNGIYILYDKARQSYIYSTFDDGQSWNLVSKGLGNKQVTDIFGAGDYLFASTKEGLYRLYTGPNSVEEESLLPIKFYPVPARDIIFMKNNYYNLTGVKAIDMMGREYEISEFSNDYFDVSKLETGVYIAKLIFDGSWFLTKKFIKQ